MHSVIYLLITGSPRLVSASADLSINVSTQPSNVTFQLHAFPAPQLLNITMVTNEEGVGVIRPARVDLIKVKCTTSRLVYVIKCGITVNGATREDGGVYNVTFGNHLGETDISFVLNVNGENVSPHGLNC